MNESGLFIYCIAAAIPWQRVEREIKSVLQAMPACIVP